MGGLYRDNGKENGNHYSIVGCSIVYDLRGGKVAQGQAPGSGHQRDTFDRGNERIVLSGLLHTWQPYPYSGAIWGGLYKDNGKENGNYYNIIGYILGLYSSSRDKSPRVSRRLDGLCLLSGGPLWDLQAS